MILLGSEQKLTASQLTFEVYQHKLPAPGPERQKAGDSPRLRKSSKSAAHTPDVIAVGFRVPTRVAIGEIHEPCPVEVPRTDAARPVRDT